MPYIYCLQDPRDNSVRYVGLTKRSIDVRFQDHLNEAKRKQHPKDCWIQELYALNLKPHVLMLEEVERDLVIEREKFWIAFFKEEGCSLTNMNHGGSGLYELTPEQRQHAHEVQQELAKDPEWLRKVSEGIKRSWADPEVKTKKKAALKAAWEREGYREFKSQQAKENWKDPEYREKIIGPQRGRKRSPETIAKIVATRTKNNSFKKTDEEKKRIAKSVSRTKYFKRFETWC